MPALDEADHARDRLGGVDIKPSGAVPAEGQGPLITAMASSPQANGAAAGEDDLLGGADGGYMGPREDMPWHSLPTGRIDSPLRLPLPSLLQVRP